MFDIFIRVFSSVLAHAAAVVFIYAIFRMEIKDNHRQIAILSLVMAGAYYVIRFGFESKMYFPATAAVLVLGLMVVRNYPFYYAFIIGGLGYLIAGLLDEVITFGLMSGLDITLKQLIDSTGLFVLSQLLAMLFLLGLAVLFVSQKWGFVFIYKRFRNRKWILKPHNFIWAFSMLAGMIIMQVTILKVETSSLNWIFMIVLLVGFTVALLITGRENRKVYNDLKRIVKEGTGDFKLY
jgi:hypothetical protein